MKGILPTPRAATSPLDAADALPAPNREGPAPQGRRGRRGPKFGRQNEAIDGVRVRLGQALRQIRVRAGYSVDAAARRMGVTIDTVHRVERGLGTSTGIVGAYEELCGDQLSFAPVSTVVMREVPAEPVRPEPKKAALETRVRELEERCRDLERSCSDKAAQVQTMTDELARRARTIDRLRGVLRSMGFDC